MKRIVLILILTVFCISLSAQEVSKRDIVIQKTTPMLHVNGVGGYINFYNGDVTLVHGSDELNVNGGRLDVNANLKVGSSSSLTIGDIDMFSEKYALYNSSGDTISPYMRATDLIDGDTIYPNITSAAADTTGVTPGKIGDIYIDTLHNKIYISKSASRGGWLILN